MLEEFFWKHCSFLANGVGLIALYLWEESDLVGSKGGVLKAFFYIY
jgi:hypothetical protein